MIEHDKSFLLIAESTADLIVNALNNVDLRSAVASSVLQSFFLIESAANICISELDVSKNFIGELDKLPTLAKLELYLLVTSGGKKKLDRGAKLYQDVAELKMLRDLSVHPKKVYMNWEEKNDGIYVGTPRRSPRLGIILRPLSSSPKDALNCFRVVNGFLSDFFKNICELKDSEILKILTAPYGNHKIGRIVSNSEAFKVLHSEYNIDLSYIGVNG